MLKINIRKWEKPQTPVLIHNRNKELARKRKNSQMTWEINKITGYQKKFTQNLLRLTLVVFIKIQGNNSVFKLSRPLFTMSSLISETSESESLT